METCPGLSNLTHMPGAPAQTASSRLSRRLVARMIHGASAVPPISTPDLSRPQKFFDHPLVGLALGLAASGLGKLTRTLQNQSTSLQSSTLIWDLRFHVCRMFQLTLPDLGMAATSSQMPGVASSILKPLNMSTQPRFLVEGACFLGSKGGYVQQSPHKMY